MLVNFLNGIIEAGWLLALAAIPVFFNPYSTRIFEADKTYILRSITIAMLAAWIITKLATNRPAARETETEKTQPPKNAGSIILPLVAVFAAVYLISSILSITPYFSFWGYFLREEGFYTLICYLIIFFLVFKNLRHKEQLNRLLNVIILTASIISIYGILQSLGIDAVAWQSDNQTRVTSTLGNPIFFGAYMVLVIPIIIARLVETFSKGLKNNLTAAALYSVILLINLAPMIVAGSRGPLIGFLFSLFLFVLLFSRARRLRWLFFSAIALAVLIVGFFIILNIPDGPLAKIRPSFGRLGQLYEPETGGGKVRLLIWQGAADILKSSPARLLFGYGLESLPSLYHTSVPASYARYEGASIPDHSHNETFDILITSGILGLLAYLAIIFAAVYYTLKYLGLIASNKAGIWLAIMAAIGALLGLIIPIIIGKEFLIGLGIPFGFLAGLLAYILVARQNEPDSPAENSKAPPNKSILLIGLMAAIIGHFIELQFGIGVTTTRLYFWVYLALILFILAPKTLPDWQAGATPLQQKEIPNSNLQITNSLPALYGLLSGFIFALILFVLLNKDFVLLASVPNNLYYILLAISAFSIIFISFIIRQSAKNCHCEPAEAGEAIPRKSDNTASAHPRNDKKAKIQISVPANTSSGLSIAIFIITAFIWFGVFYLVLRSMLNNVASDTIPILNFNYAFIFLTMFALAFFLYKSGPKLTVPSAKASAFIFAAIALPVAIIAIYYTNIKEARADMYCFMGQLGEKSSNWQASITYYTKSIAHSPRTDYYYECLSRSYNGLADYPKTIESMNKAVEMNKYNLYHYFDMARYYRNWSNSLAGTDKKASDAKLRLALEVYEKVLKLAPNNARIAEETGEVYFLLGDYPKARDMAREAIRMDDQFSLAYLLLVNTYQQLNEAPEKIVDAYEKAFTYDSGNKDLRHEIMKYGEDYYAKKNYDIALRVNLALVRVEPYDFQHRHNCAAVLDEMGRIDEAIEYEKKAIDLVNPRQKDGLKKFLKHLEEKKAAPEKK